MTLANYDPRITELARFMCPFCRTEHEGRRHRKPVPGLRREGVAARYAATLNLIGLSYCDPRAALVSDSVLLAPEASGVSKPTSYNLARLRDDFRLALAGSGLSMGDGITVAVATGALALIAAGQGSPARMLRMPISDVFAVEMGGPEHDPVKNNPALITMALGLVSNDPVLFWGLLGVSLFQPGASGPLTIVAITTRHGAFALGRGQAQDAARLAFMPVTSALREAAADQDLNTERRQPSLAGQLTDLEKAHQRGLLSDAEYEAARAKIVTKFTE
ncbi:hypothetical protein [Microbacterium sp.]|uniref:hypothetical protein n=1 Tax=Microbacterium sp. TaxID=51671 RepID=UPI0027370D5B|nr:hypothetical protein [Microbacterium sp.]MDP3950525.1 hypothetical protein [Microbacterium sp.]